MSDRIEVLDPTAMGPSQRLPLAPPLPTLRGRVLGIRIDDTWKSFTPFAHAVADVARQGWGVRDVVLFDPGTRVGTTDDEKRKMAAFVASVDAAIVGLGT